MCNSKTLWQYSHFVETGYPTSERIKLEALLKKISDFVAFASENKTALEFRVQVCSTRDQDGVLVRMTAEGPENPDKTEYSFEAPSDA